MADKTPLPDLPNWTWLGGDSGLARRVGKPVRNFLNIEAAGGILLLIATAVALIWANSPWAGSYEIFGIPTLNWQSVVTTWGDLDITSPWAT